ncbi:MAG: hypothetical protein MJ238_04555 [Bacilli bacterium]|nr:hypothetical protein [Bacilli bacterium]
MEYPVRLTIFVIACILVFGACLFWILYSPIKHFVWKKKPNDMFYKKVYKVVRNTDFYLVNNLKFKTGEGSFTIVPHVIGGNKYLYLITEYYYDGCLEARGDDRSWIYYPRDGKKQNVSNPIFANKKMLSDFIIRLGFSQSMVKGIVVVNDDCFIARFDKSVGQSVLCTISNLENVILGYEATEVAPFNTRELEQVIRDLHDSNKVG